MASATASHEPKAQPQRLTYAEARADLDARARAGKTVQGRNSKGQFLRGVKVSATNVVPFPRPANENVAMAEESKPSKTEVHFELLGALVASLPWSRRIKMIKHLDAVMRAAGDDERGVMRKGAAKVARTLTCRAEELAGA